MEYKDEIEIDGKTYVPLKTSLIEKKVVQLPSKTEEYNSTSDLVEDIKKYIHKYYEYDSRFEDLDAYYALFTWVHDKFSVTPYRRVLGDYGTGKSRFLRVLGNICYRPISISSASSVASIYRMIDKLHGTVVIDEADFYATNFRAEIVKILNSGYQKGVPIVKIDLDTFEPVSFDVFGPKIIGSRERYDDDALESRCITHETDICIRNDIPSVLSQEFHQESLILRNKLLLWRFRNYWNKTEPDSELKNLAVEPRLKEVMLPLSSIIEDASCAKKLREIVLQYQKDTMRRRGLGLAKIILESIIILHNKKAVLAIGRIASHVRERLGLESDYELAARRVGSIIDRKLGLNKERKKDGTNVPIVVIWEPARIRRCCKKYGVDFNNLTSLTSSEEDTARNTSASIEGFIPLKSEHEEKNTKDANSIP